MSNEENPYFLSVEKARQEVENIIAARALTRSGYFEPVRKIASIWTAKDPSTRSGLDPEQQEVYIMNFEDSSGFAIVSSDNRIGLMGLALYGSLNKGDVITDPGFGMTITNMKFLSNRDSCDIGEDEYEIVFGNWTNTFYEPTYGYCPVKWCQDSLFREFCYTSQGDPAVTGCAPVAIAQLMTIYKYPTSYQQYWFNWDAMIANPLYVDPIGEHTVARLLYLLGTTNNLDVTYGVEESGSDFPNVPRTLENFGYTSGGNVQDYNTGNVVYDLQLGYPVLINGYSYKITTTITYLWGLYTDIHVSYSDGHCWLGDGLFVRSRPVYYYYGDQLLSTDYENQYFILCKFGQKNGLKDGYYLSEIFNYNFGPAYLEGYHSRSTTVTTEGTNDFYQFKMQAVTGIRR